MKILFVCVGNSCRSQMAEGIASSMGFEAASAGTHPASSVATHALKVLHGRGIDTSNLRPKSVDDMDPSAYDMVVSMGCGVHCPAIKIDEDWALEDPVGQAYEVYEQTATEIQAQLERLMHQFS